ncbi:MAG: pseudouridine synthase [Verrucomicrobiota bacterium]
MKLDRLIGKHCSLGRKKAREAILSGRVSVDGITARAPEIETDRFMSVRLDDAIVQTAKRLLHIMLHKPAGVVSSTSDPEHPTVLDLIDDPDRDTLHLAGRLDKNTTGLMLLTNDGRFSKQLMHPDHKVPKTYRVETSGSISADAIAAFAAGFYFHTENLTTLPAKLKIIGDREALATLQEGRYHQIKRMFHRTGNRVVRLHRERIGGLSLPGDLASGNWRHMTALEIAAALNG